jgi:hypothetical protein
VGFVLDEAFRPTDFRAPGAAVLPFAAIRAWGRRVAGDAVVRLLIVLRAGVLRAANALFLVALVDAAIEQLSSLSFPFNPQNQC